MIRPILADGIDFPIVLGFGLVILVPLMVFEVCIEAAVLKRTWAIPFKILCGFTFVANCLSLLAGIPSKFLNSILYGFLLPRDLPGFFTWYPFAVMLGTLIYFAVTVVVEGAYAFRWLRRHGYSISAANIWKGVLVANLASYAVVAPIHYYLTRPYSPTPHTFVRNTEWTRHPSEKVLFIDTASQKLKCMHLNGSEVETIVPAMVRDYVVSADLKMCLFRDTNGNICFCNNGKVQQAFVVPSKERIMMSSVAFSPSGRYVAFASESGSISLLNTETGWRTNQAWLQIKEFEEPSLAWSTNETTFYFSRFENGERVKMTIQPSGSFIAESLEQSNTPDLLVSYARISDGAWYGGDDWGPVFNSDTCAGLRAFTEPGLGSHFSIYHGTNWGSRIDYVTVNPGLLHLARFCFTDVAFLGEGDECLFSADDYTYLLNIKTKQVGTLVHGNRFILLTPRYQKKLEKRTGV